MLRRDDVPHLKAGLDWAPYTVRLAGISLELDAGFEGQEFGLCAE